MLNILEGVSNEMPKLFTLLTESFKASDNASAEALKQSFRFPGSQKDVKLFVILAYVYTLIFEVEKNAFYTLIKDQKHVEYAKKVIRLHESGVGNIISTSHVRISPTIHSCRWAGCLLHDRLKRKSCRGSSDWRCVVLWNFAKVHLTDHAYDLSV